jgi:hypothetical protein
MGSNRVFLCGSGKICSRGGPGLQVDLIDQISLSFLGN